MQYRDPEFFFLLALLIPLVVWFYLRPLALRKAALMFSSIMTLNSVSPTWRTSLRNFPDVLKVLSFLFLILALVRPQTSSTLVKKNVDGIDIVVALDISESMQIEDMKPYNRIDAAKDIIGQFLKKRVSDRLAVIVFAGESFTLVPLTLDYDLLQNRVAQITTAREANIKDGTAIGVALANAAGNLRESAAKSRVIIFLTDGENNSGTIDPATALDIAKGYNIKIYSIGIGRDGPTQIPQIQEDVFGRKVKTYVPFESSVNDELLGRMASETGGKYYRATDEKAFREVFADIDRLEKTKIDINRFTKFKEEFAVFVWLSLICYMLAIFLSFTILRRVP